MLLVLIGWLAFGYFLLACFSIMLTGDHYLVDVLGGVIYASAAYLLVARPPRWLRWLTARLAGDERPADATA